MHEMQRVGKSRSERGKKPDAKIMGVPSSCITFEFDDFCKYSEGAKQGNGKEKRRQRNVGTVSEIIIKKEDKRFLFLLFQRRMMDGNTSHTCMGEVRLIACDVTPMYTRSTRLVQ